MRLLFRLLVTFVTGVSTFYFAFWMGGALLFGLNLPIWLSFITAWAAALLVGRYVWKRTASVQAGLISSIVLGAFVVGGIGFAAGFFGPLILTPEANQGPLLGIFITGPLGFIVGAIGGAVYWKMQRRLPLSP